MRKIRLFGSRKGATAVIVLLRPLLYRFNIKRSTAQRLIKAARPSHYSLRHGRMVGDVGGMAVNGS